MRAGSTTPSMHGRTVVITGANSGVGKATATALAAAGADTVITARHPDRGRAALADIRRTSGSDQVDLVVFDLADLASVRRGAEQILDRCPSDRRADQQRRSGPVGAPARPSTGSRPPSGSTTWARSSSPSC